MKNKKKGLNLIAKFMLMSLAPLIVTFVVAQFAISLVATQVAENLVGNMLASNVHLINNAMGLQVQISSMSPLLSACRAVYRRPSASSVTVSMGILRESATMPVNWS